MIDQTGNLVWSAELDLKASALPIAGPVEIQGGYAFESYRDGYLFFYKLDYDGNLLWKSDKIPSVKFRGDMAIRQDGVLMASYKQTSGNENVLAIVEINSATGQIISHTYLNIEQSIDFEHLYQDLDLRGNLRMIGNKVLLEKYPIDIPYFFIQFPADYSLGTCFGWEALDIKISNDIPLLFSSIDTVLLDTRMTALASDGATQVAPYEFPIKDVCNEKRDPEVTLKDTSLSCETDWLVRLPSDQFNWEDGVATRDRVLNVAGTYRASNQNCLAPMVYEYRLSKPECNCQVYLPTAITANADDLNDSFEIYSDCQILDFTLTVFNRWGMKVYEQKNKAWDGTGTDGSCEPGLYLVKVTYRLEKAGGGYHEGQALQETILIR
ncbi:MAG: gliding motility-associated C-terminal domain-containing protein [Saprospiraceae bacterium]|nr:gliding motility-associated C-terminal domain-containing protein [Saprospiraceae bacterium]